MPGPIAKRSEERRRRNVTPGLTKGQAGPRPTPPPVPHGWHSIARQWFNSLKTSGQSEYYEASDWAHALFVGEAMTRWLSGTSDDKMPAQLFAAIMQGMSELLTTEGARRRAKLELERVPEKKPASLAIMQQYRAKGDAKIPSDQGEDAGNTPE